MAASRSARFALALVSTSPIFEFTSPSLAPRSPTSLPWSASVAVGGELADLFLAVSDELAKLLELTLRSIRLALGARAPELVARVLELLGHVAYVLDQLTSGPVHGGQGGAVHLKLVVQLANA